MKLLLVEDDREMADVIREVLKSQYYLVDLTTDGQTALELAEMFDYDLILLDMMLPRVNGMEFCQRRRQSGDLTPILLITGQDEPSYKVHALDAGADDYLVKPFDVQELLARIRALLRRGTLSSSPLLQWGPLCLNPNNCRVTYQGNPLVLTAKEYGMLELFLRNHNRIFSKSALLDHLWSIDESPSEMAVRTQIKSLRQKLKRAGASPNLIETIYGLGYRLNPAFIDQQRAFTPPNESNDSIDLVLLNLWDKHKDKYIQQVTFIQQAIAAWQQNKLTEEFKKKARIYAHTLSGSLGTFGLNQASEKAKEIEKIFSIENELIEIDLDYLSALNLKLMEELKKENGGGKSNIQGGGNREEKKTEQEMELFEKQYKINHLLIVDDDLALAETLIQEAKLWEMTAEVATDLGQARTIIANQPPDIILLDLCFAEEEESGLKLLEEVTQLYPSIPTIVFTALDNLDERVKVARLGGKAFLNKPISSYEVMETICQVLQQNALPQPKIMLVDDDAQLLELIATILQPWDFDLTLLNQPKNFWQVLEKTNPDLLILDLEMPEISGFDLCQVVRSDPQWHELPILFLSAHTEPEVIRKGFQAGADDYIFKPIVTAELVTRILNRLARERYRRQFSYTDSLTGIANRRQSLHDLTRLIRLAQRQNKSCCFVILDLDHFKQVNDLYGHEMGDQVLRRLGERLKNTFRAEDVVARWGGEEFVIGLYNISQKAGQRRITEFLHLWNQEVFLTDSGKNFTVSFSAGLAEYPWDGKDLQTLYQLADHALYQAKAAGRNRVYSYGKIS